MLDPFVRAFKMSLLFVYQFSPSNRLVPSWINHVPLKSSPGNLWQQDSVGTECLELLDGTYAVHF